MEAKFNLLARRAAQSASSLPAEMMHPFGLSMVPIRRTILVIALGVVAAMALFPPWHQSNGANCGYGFLFLGTGSTACGVDFPRFAIQGLAVSIIASLIFIFGDRTRLQIGLLVVFLMGFGFILVTYYISRPCFLNYNSSSVTCRDIFQEEENAKILEKQRKDFESWFGKK